MSEESVEYQIFLFAQNHIADIEMMNINVLINQLLKPFSVRLNGGSVIKMSEKEEIYTTEYEKRIKFVKPLGDFIFLGEIQELQTKFGTRYIFKAIRGEDEVIVIHGSFRLHKLMQRLNLQPKTKINIQRKGNGVKTVYILTVYKQK